MAAVARRVGRLEQTGVISGYTALVDDSKLGATIEALVEVYAADRTAPADMSAMLSGLDEVLSAFTVSGEPDAVVRIRVPDIAHLEQSVERLRRNQNIVRTRTMIILSTVIDHGTTISPDATPS